MTGSETFVVFFGIFWAAVLASAGRYRPFETHRVFRGGNAQTRRRFVAAFLLLNVGPLVWFWLLATYIVPDTVNGWAVISGANGGLSVFGFTRIFHGVLLTEPMWRRFYEEEERDYVLNSWRPTWRDEPGGWEDHIVPGVVYLSVFLLLSWAFGLIASGS